MKYDLVALDAFASGQMQSKLWLVTQLEQVLDTPPPGGYNICLLGGWYGVTNLILRIRGNIPIREVRSYDIDPDVEPIADKINNLWEWQGWQFKASTLDVNQLEFDDYPDIIINTSVEHIEDQTWFTRIPKGTIVALQSTNMPHDDHHSCHQSEHELLADYPLDTILFQGNIRIDYEDWGFNRWMIIGKK